MNEKSCPACMTIISDYHATMEKKGILYHLSCAPQEVEESFNDFKIKQLVDRKDLMVKYLNLKVSEEDWHGVQDAASDLRDLQVELDTRKDLKNGQ